MNQVESLSHVVRQLPNGGMVLVLNTGAVITPEAEAMLQALHSRSVGGIREHLKILAERGAEKFMSSFYVGYGHKSIGDCGTPTIFIEGVSMLAAKAIQDWELYSGQEASTRYIDFALQPFLDPCRLGNTILEKWREFYVTSQDPVREHLKKLFPIQDGEKEATYEKAIAARSFDILRGFLPAGATTNLAWHTNLRQAADKLMLLRHHPLQEVKQIALVCEDALKEAFPSSFGHKQYESTESYNRMWMENHYYFPSVNNILFMDKDEMPPEFEVFQDNMDYPYFLEHRELLATRPAKTELPKFLKEGGTLGFTFLLDFGSFRDIQRHRAITQRMPLLTTRFGFEEWYLKQLPEQVRHRALDLLSEQEGRIDSLNITRVPFTERQYYIAMGYRTINRIVGTLPALVYLVELRATRFVHPTLRKRAKQMADALLKRLKPFGLALHLDPEPDRFDVKRGEHDIILKN